MTRTYAVLEVSAQAYAEIREKLVAAGYLHAIHEGPDGETIDMQGVAIAEEE